MDQEDKTSADLEEEKNNLQSYINETLDRIKAKSDQRTVNESISYWDLDLSLLDSNVKRNCSFVKKLRNMTEAQRESIVKDMLSLNLSRYISEVSSAIIDAKIKMSDIPMAIKICSLLHQRYSDFSSLLLEGWCKVLPKKVTDLSSMNLSKMRIDIRFFAELITSGIFTLKEGLPILGNLLTLLVTNDKENHNNLNILLSFCRHCGDDYAGLYPRKMKLYAERFGMELPRSNFLPSDRQRGLRNLLKDYYKSLVAHVIKDHKALRNHERQNRKILISKGELSEKRKEKYEQAQVAFSKLLSSTQQMADILDEDPPELPPDSPDGTDELDDNIVTLDVSNRFKLSLEADSGTLWEDEDTKSFYEDLIDIRALVPPVLYKDSVKEGYKDIKDKVAKDEVAKEQEEKSGDSSVVGMMETVIEENEDETSQLDSEDENGPFLEEDADGTGSEEEHHKEEGPTQDAKLVHPANKVALDAFLISLLSCVNRDMIDKAAISFCTDLNTKYNRKKLVRALFTVPRTRLDLLPFYSRLVATLSPIMPHISNDLVQLLKQDFKFHIRKKDQINIESKIKNVRFIGELVKFGKFPKTEALHCLKLLLLDFTHHQIEMACNLIETCGRYLFRSVDCHHRCKLLLDQLMRKKNLLPCDSRYITMIENAYYFANPPESQNISKEEVSPMQEYIRKLIYKDLNKTNIEKILQLVRRLDWDNKEISEFTIVCFISVWNIRFFNIRCVANLLAALYQYQDWVIPIVIDSVLEDIRLMMEINHPKFNQRRISMIRYLGELYNYRLIESSVVFRVFYSLITYGVTYDTQIFSDIDPPEHLFRIRLVCQLLDTCGQYFNSGASKKKLDCFIIFFQRYFWFKKSHDIFSTTPFPVAIEFMFRDYIIAFRPKFKFASSYQESIEATENLINELKPKLAELFPSLKVCSNQENDDELRSLNPIEEVDEEEPETNFIDCDESEEEWDQEQRIRPNITTDDGTDTESEGEDVGNHAPLKLISCVEDDDFKKDFERMMSESLMSRGQEAMRSSMNDIGIPMSKMSIRKMGFDDKQKNGNESTLNLMVMTRAKGNKRVLKPVQVPIDSDLALSLLEKEEAERMEKEQVKRLTLDINERREMEDEMAEKNIPLVMNLNREGRRKYQHPKGVPDIDLIFGNK